MVVAVIRKFLETQDSVVGLPLATSRFTSMVATTIRKRSLRWCNAVLTSRCTGEPTTPYLNTPELYTLSMGGLAQLQTDWLDYKWQSNSWPGKRLKALEDQNTRLKRLLAMPCSTTSP
jgi:hypothetical protein